MSLRNLRNAREQATLLRGEAPVSPSEPVPAVAESIEIVGDARSQLPVSPGTPAEVALRLSWSSLQETWDSIMHFWEALPKQPGQMAKIDIEGLEEFIALGAEFDGKFLALIDLRESLIVSQPELARQLLVPDLVRDLYELMYAQILYTHTMVMLNTGRYPKSQELLEAMLANENFLARRGSAQLDALKTLHASTSSGT